MKIEGKSFIVTGGCGALGGSCVKDILAKGGFVSVFDVIPEEAGNAMMKEYSPEGKAIYFKIDISDLDSVNDGCEKTLAAFPKGSLAGGVHCAAFNRSRVWSNKMKDSAKDFKDALMVNAYGTFIVDACISDAINSQYPDQGVFFERVTEERGVIINFASAVATICPARCLTYAPTKTAVLGITSCAADFLGPSGIRVNSISPSVAASKIMGDRLPYMLKELDAAAIFPRRTVDPTEISSGVIFLIENGMMNAFDLRVDGAWRTISNWGGEKDPRANAPSLE